MLPFVRTFPEVRAPIRQALSAQLFEAALQGKFDAAKCLHPAFVLPKSLR